MHDTPEQVTRRRIADGLRAHFEAMLEQRIDRHIEISHHPITPNHHFTKPSNECIDLYTDGHFFSTVMVTQAVAEGIRRFVVERNGIKWDDGMKGPEIAELLVNRGIISRECADASNRIWNSFRNDVHHMNPKVAEIPEKISFSELAKRNIQDLAIIEKEVFAVKLSTGCFIPVHTQYWDIEPDGMCSAFLRCGP